MSAIRSQATCAGWLLKVNYWPEPDSAAEWLDVRFAESGGPGSAIGDSHNWPTVLKKSSVATQPRRGVGEIARFFACAWKRVTAPSTLIHPRRLKPSCGGLASTAERTVAPARMCLESLTAKAGIREQNRLTADNGRLACAGMDYLFHK